MSLPIGFTRTTLQQLAVTIKAGFGAALTGANLALRRSNLAIASILLAGAVNSEYGYLDWIIENCLLPDSATGPYADRWGNFKGVFRNPAVAAVLDWSIAGTVPGTPVPQGTLLQLQSGIAYATLAPATIATGPVTVPVQAILPAPVAGQPPVDATQWNAGIGATLSLVQAIAGVDGSGVVTAIVTAGVSAESDLAYRARYLPYYSAPPQGGDQEDYVEWAEAVPIVTRAWAIGCGFGAGTVVIYVMCDATEAAHQGFPQGSNGAATGESRWPAATGDQLIVANALYGKRNVTALVVACAPAAAPQNFTVKYVPPAQQGAVEAALAAVLLTEGGADGQSVVELADLQAAVRAVPGCNAALVQAPTDNITTSAGILPTLGTVTFL